MDVQYRAATQDDIDQVRELLASVRGDPRCLSHEQLLVACAGREIIGCVRLKELATGDKELASLAVATGWRNCGIGSTLVSLLLRTEASRPIYLLCFAERERFYARHGFTLACIDELPAALREEYLRLSAVLTGPKQRVIAMALVR